MQTTEDGGKVQRSLLTTKLKKVQEGLGAGAGVQIL